MKKKSNNKVAPFFLRVFKRIQNAKSKKNLIKEKRKK